MDVDKYLAENDQFSPYDSAYFDKYVGYADSEMGRKLTEARVNLVNKYTDGEVVDVGIGCGQFIFERDKLAPGLTFGNDICPKAIEMLKLLNKWRDLSSKFRNASFFDSLEHFRDPRIALNCVEHYAFISIPIFRNYEHVLRSKHLRPTEHFLYFSDVGLKSFMWNAGFRAVYQDRMEEDLGREDIGTYVFRRK